MATKPTKPKRKSKGKRHPAHAASFKNVADILRRHANASDVDLSTPQALLRVIAEAMGTEGKRVRSIVR
jgi:hypothetical protein